MEKREDKYDENDGNDLLIVLQLFISLQTALVFYNPEDLRLLQLRLLRWSDAAAYFAAAAAAAVFCNLFFLLGAYAVQMECTIKNCRELKLSTTPGVSKLRPAGQIRPAKPFHPARGDILSITKKK